MIKKYEMSSGGGIPARLPALNENRAPEGARLELQFVSSENKTGPEGPAEDATLKRYKFWRVTLCPYQNLISSPVEMADGETPLFAATEAAASTSPWLAAALATLKPRTLASFSALAYATYTVVFLLTL